MALDVSSACGGSLERATARVKAKVLVIVSRTDHTVTPGPPLDLAARIHAQVVELGNNCGHHASECDNGQANRAAASFLEALPARPSP